MTTMESIAAASPYPGFRSFDEEEFAPYFFGRDGCVDEMLRILQVHRFLAVVGVSGGGKSSLVRAGLLRRLVRGGFSGAGRWHVAELTPSGQPCRNLAE